MFLIVGGDSEIGGAAFAALKAQGHAATATTRRRGPAAHDRLFLDLTTSLKGWEPPKGATSACVCAAVARLADCAADPPRSAHVNVTQTLALADSLLGRGVYVLFLSTNQVFDGRVAQVPPEAPHSPVSEYGKQKARTEAALLDKMAARSAGRHFTSRQGGIAAHAAVAELGRRFGASQADQRLQRYEACPHQHCYSVQRHTLLAERPGEWSFPTDWPS